MSHGKITHLESNDLFPDAREAMSLTVCGRWVPEARIREHRRDVTCALCRKWSP